MKHVIVIIVHGVGDHSTVDILDEMHQGMLREPSFKHNRVSPTVFSDFPRPDGTSGPQIALRIKTRKVLCNVVPVVWSRVRVRGGAFLKDYPIIAGGIERLALFVALAAPALTALCTRKLPPIGDS